MSQRQAGPRGKGADLRCLCSAHVRDQSRLQALHRLRYRLPSLVFFFFSGLHTIMPINSHLPRYVKKAFKDGYEVEHIGFTMLDSASILRWPGSKSSRLHLRQSKHSLRAFVFHVGITMITAQRYSNTSSMMTLTKHYHRNDSSSFLCGCFLPQRA